jgi:exosortase E/protease (VPEID-CTERM system)
VLVGEAHYLPPLALTVCVAVALFGGDRLRRAAAAVREEATGGPSPAVVAVHLAGFAVFVWLTARLLDPATGSGPGSDVLFLAWLVVGLAQFAAWCLVVLPPRAWAVLARRAGWVVALTGLTAGAAVFASSQATAPLWDRMADGTFTAVRALLSVGFDSVVSRPADRVLGTDTFRVHIAPECSGYEGLGLVGAFVGLYLVFRRDALRFPHALLLLPAGLAAAWAANVARIAALIAVGSAGWPEVARGGFHSQSGWLAFNAVALGVIAVSRRSSFITRARQEEAGGVNPTLPYLAPLFVLVAAATVTGALAAGGFDAAYGLRVAAAGTVLWCFRRTVAGLGWSAAPWAAIGIGVLVFAGWLGLGLAAGNAHEASPIPDGLAGLPGWWAAGWVVLRVVGAVVVVPLAEELAFRGFLLRRLQSADFDRVPPTRWSWPAVLGSSLVFGLLHPGWWVAGTLAGVGYAAAYRVRGRLADAVIAHAVTNALLAVVVLSSGSWWLW